MSGTGPASDYDWLDGDDLPRTVVNGDDVFVRALGFDYQNHSIADSAVRQCQRALANAEAALEQAGTSGDRIRYVELIVLDQEDFMACCQALEQQLGDVEIEGPANVKQLRDSRVKVGLDVWAKRIPS